MNTAVSSPILIHRAKHDAENPYLKVSQAVVQDDRLSITALGVLVYLLSHKETWHIDPTHLAKRLRLNIATVRKLLHELSEYGYVKLRERFYDAQGHIMWTDYQVYECPQPAEAVDAQAIAPHKEDLLPKSTIHEKTMHGDATHGKAMPIIRNNLNNKKENDSPAEKMPSRATAALTPHGDARAGFASRSDIEQGQNRSAVKVQDSSTAKSLHDQDSFSTAPRAATIAPTPARRTVGEPPQRTPVPHHPEPQQTQSPHAPQPSSAAVPQDKAPSGARLPASPMQAVIMYAFKLPRGGYAGKIGQFFAGSIRTRHRDLWARSQPEIAASPQEVYALLMWYSQHAAYAKSFIEHGGKLPSTPAILRDRLDEFRDLPDHAQRISAAEPRLAQLMRGEAPALPAPSAKPAQAVEAAQAYKPIKPALDPAYQDRRQAGDLEVAARLFGPIS